MGLLPAEAACFTNTLHPQSKCMKRGGLQGSQAGAAQLMSRPVTVSTRALAAATSSLGLKGSPCRTVDLAVWEPWETVGGLSQQQRAARHTQEGAAPHPCLQEEHCQGDAYANGELCDNNAPMIGEQGSSPARQQPSSSQAAHCRPGVTEVLQAALSSLSGP